MLDENPKMLTEKEKVEEPEIKIEDVLEDIGEKCLWNFLDKISATNRTLTECWTAGGYGKFQKIFSFLAVFPQMTAALIILSPVFTGTSKVPLFCTNKTQFLEDFSCLENCTEATGDEIFSSVVQEVIIKFFGIQLAALF